MNQPHKNSQSLLEQIFEGRNKNYGAYELRLNYDRTLCRALLWVVLSTGSLSFGFYFTKKVLIEAKTDTGQVDPREFYTVPADLTPVPKTDAHQAKNSGASASNIQARVIRNNAVVIDEPESTPSTNTLTSASAGTETVEVPESALNSTPMTLSPDSLFESYNVDTYPEFEGGMGALRRFVASHLRYPPEEAERGQEGIVLVRFVVDEDGKVFKVGTQISAGAAFDKEAMRVVSLLPPFKSPGKAAGRAVKVAFTLPVKFRSQ